MSGELRLATVAKPSARIIARLDVKAPHLIKGIHLEGLRKIGDPNVFARRYFDAGIDEIIYMDAVASLYGRNNLFDIVDRTTSDVFVPITVGGGLRSVGDVSQALRSGADKVAVNTAAVRRPELISEIARTFGAQCMVLSIESKRTGPGRWEAYVDNGREHTGLDAVEWAKRGEALGAGEILLTSIDREGTRTGFEDELIGAVSSQVSIPVIASGGMGKLDDVASVIKGGRADAVAIADGFHYGHFTVDQVRQAAASSGIEVRRSPAPACAQTASRRRKHSRVTVADYGIGNLRSVVRACEALDAAVLVTNDPAAVADAERLIIPGVGAFVDCMRALRAAGFDQAIHDYLRRERPLLGICVGMQMLFDASEEFGLHPGLSLIPGQVRRIPAAAADGLPIKVPNVGWRALERPSGANDDHWAPSILSEISEGDAVYFVHSFSPVPRHDAHRIADVSYGGHRLSAVVGRDQIVGTQFHPEKSGDVGLAILAGFLSL